jgi:ADP-heptose:LPS heptosyltransferase
MTVRQSRTSDREPAQMLRDLHSFGTRPEADGDGNVPDRLLAELVASSEHHAALVAAVCALATDPDPSVRRRGQQLLFSTVAESLGDAFDPRSVAVHDSVFAHVIECCRRLPVGAQLDERLARFGVTNRADLLRRRAALAPATPLAEATRARVRKVFVLSRITLGADVAVTSIVIQAIARAFPSADRYLVGPPAVRQVLAGLAGIQLVEQTYDRRGLMERFGSWLEMTDAISRETAGLDDDEYVIIDPDSRLTQLGLLPVAGAAVPYLFFESRAYLAAGHQTLGALTAEWLGGVLSIEDAASLRPRVALPESDRLRAEAMVDALRRNRAFVVAMNLGVGGNVRKRIPGRFELDLVRALLSEGSAVVIDHGAGEDEARVRAIVDALRHDGRRVAHIHGAEDPSGVLSACDVLAYSGEVGPFAALVGASDLYVGYDSAFQHIAAAQGIPVVDLFVDPPSPAFSARWRPHSAAAVMVIETSADDAGHRSALARVLDAQRRARQAPLHR